MTDINIRNRFLLFLIGCIGTRSLLVYLATTKNQTILNIMGGIAFIISFSFIYLYITDGRKTGPEVFGDKIWWNDLRPIHGLLYFLFAYFVFIKNENAWVFLAIDVVIGLISFLAYHYFSGNFNKVF